MKTYFLLLLLNAGLILADSRRNLFYDFYNAQMQHAKNILLFRRSINANLTQEDRIEAMLINKLESAGGIEKFIEIYSRKCLLLKETYHTCSWVDQLKKGRAQLTSSNDEIVEAIKSQIEETTQSIHAQSKKNNNHPLIPIYAQYRQHLNDLLKRSEQLK